MYAWRPVAYLGFEKLGGPLLDLSHHWTVTVKIKKRWYQVAKNSCMIRSKEGRSHNRPWIRPWWRHVWSVTRSHTQLNIYLLQYKSINRTSMVTPHSCRIRLFAVKNQRNNAYSRTTVRDIAKARVTNRKPWPIFAIVTSGLVCDANKRAKLLPVWFCWVKITK